MRSPLALMLPLISQPGGCSEATCGRRVGLASGVGVSAGVSVSLGVTVAEGVATTDVSVAAPADGAAPGVTVGDARLAVGDASVTVGLHRSRPAVLASASAAASSRCRD